MVVLPPPPPPPPVFVIPFQNPGLDHVWGTGIPNITFL